MGVDGVYGAWHAERRAPWYPGFGDGVPCTLLVHGTGRWRDKALPSRPSTHPSLTSPITRPDISMPSREQRALVVGVRRRKGGKLNPYPIVNTHVFRRIPKKCLKSTYSVFIFVFVTYSHCRMTWLATAVPSAVASDGAGGRECALVTKSWFRDKATKPPNWEYPV